MRVRDVSILAALLGGAWALGVCISSVIGDPAGSRADRGLLFGALITIVAMPLAHLVLSRWNVDGLRPGIRQSFRTESTLDHASVAAVLTLAIRDLDVWGIDVHEELPIRILAVTRGSWRSFGEEVQVTVSNGPDGRTMVDIKSRPRQRILLLDYGKNISNVRHLRNALQTAEAQGARSAG